MTKYNGANAIMDGAVIADMQNNFVNPVPEFESMTPRRGVSGLALTCEDMKARYVHEFYIMRKGVVPMKIKQYDGSQAFIYTNKSVAGGQSVIKLTDLIRNRPTGQQSWTVPELIEMANVYVEDNPTINQWDSIHVEKVHTKFRIINDDSTGDDLTNNDVSITIKMDRERHRDDKFEVSELPLYIHHVGDRTQGRGKSLSLEAKIMRRRRTHILVLWDQIRRTLMHFDGMDLDDTQLLSHSRRSDTGTELDKDDISKLRLRDGYYGITFAGRIRLSTRKEETFTIRDELVKRVIPGTV